jgi:uridine kinase
MLHPFTVGIAGGSASGKTTLAAALATALQQRGHVTTTIATDRYMHADRTQGPTFFSPSAGTDLFNANHPESIDWAQLFADLDAIQPPPDGPAVIVIEGLMVLHEPRLRQRLDLRVFAELDADERALRRMLRDMQGGRANRDPQFIANYYRECARVGHAQYVEPSRVYADLIVRGDAAWERLGPLLVAVVETQLGERAQG